jgi:adenylyltransferase/sulfurtransferase
MKTPNFPMGRAREAGPDAGPLSRAETERYGRHLALPEVGVEGQLRLKRAAVLLVGAGGLGAPAALYLAAAGVGRLTLVDDDRVDVSNLQRQVIFDTGDAGRDKADAARDRLSALNPHVDVEARAVRVTAENVTDLVRGHDVVIDGSDNFTTRYLINDACVRLRVPFVSGSVRRFEGQVCLFVPGDGPCYRCLFPAPPAPGTVPDCAQGGVLGVLPGIVGSIQAAEALKWILRAGDTLRGRLLRIDALHMRFTETAIARDPACPACGSEPARARRAGESSATPTREADVSVPEITVHDFKRRLDAGDDITVLDVREPHEYGICNLGGTLIPLGELPARMHELDPSREIVVHCRSGSRSARAVEFLRDAGFGKVWNLKGGIRAWSDEIDPSVPKY